MTDEKFIARFDKPLKNCEYCNDEFVVVEDENGKALGGDLCTDCDDIVFQHKIRATPLK
jgi:hypothetical protein